MKICLNCHNEFPTKVEIDGKIRNLQRRQYCLVCSPWGANQGKRVQQQRRISQTTKRCPRCQKEKPRNQFYSRRGTLGDSAYCRDCTNIQTTERHTALKAAAIGYKGGSCSLCGYDHCYDALEFHHKDPKEKDFALSKKRSRTLSGIKSELDKCVLLCANCHREVHAGIAALSR